MKRCTGSPVITDFVALKPAYETGQKEILEGLIVAHTKAETLHARLSEQDAERFKQEIKRKLYHVGCSSSHIDKRGHEFEDILNLNWEAPSLNERQKLHQKFVIQKFEQFFPEDAKEPDHLIHVTCTGYTSPSAAQILTSQRGWNTTLTSCYHLGCYGSIPAIRIGSAFLESKETKVNIVHTELCTLHFNPLNHELDQLVGQSLFADGCMKYSVLQEVAASSPYLKVMATHEAIIPNSASAMEWLIKDWGFHFKLSKEIPSLIAVHLKDYLITLCQKAGFKAEELIPKAIFAIHPGGPKIIDNIKKLLNLEEEQVEKSREILRRHGNMSSATLPHVWEAICNDPGVPSQTPVISLAFGPGLTLAGALLELH